MAYQITQWEMSDAVVEEVQVPEGLRAIKITDASYDPEDRIYQIGCTDLETTAEFRLRYWPKGVDPKTGELYNNKQAVGTLNSLMKAIFGPDAKGVPCPCDIVGAVCVANVKMKETDTGGKYPRCYSFMSADAGLAWASDIEQFFRPVGGAE